MQPGDVFGQLSGGDLWLLALETGAETRLIDGGGAAAWSPDGSRIAFAASYGGARRIWIADARGRNLRQVTSDHGNLPTTPRRRTRNASLSVERGGSFTTHCPSHTRPPPGRRRLWMTARMP